MFKTFIFLTFLATIQTSFGKSRTSFGKELLRDDSSLLIEVFPKEHLNYFQTGVKSQRLRNIYNKLKLPGDARRKEFPEKNGIITCLACRVIANALIQYRRVYNKTTEELQELAADICMNLRIQSELVCSEITKIYAPSFVFIIDENSDLTTYDLCAIVAQRENCGRPRDRMFEFSVDIIGNGPPIEGHKEASPDSGNYLKIVHFTDIHYDPRYVAGSKADCDEPICCQRILPSELPYQHQAGFWGDYRDCDLPWRTVKAAVRSMKQNHPDADIVYWTGDIVDHTVWGTSETSVKEDSKEIFKLFEEEFSYASFYPALGNHDVHPSNMFAPPELEGEFSSSWLYDFIAQTWSSWLPTESIETVRNGGYYTVRVMDGFRLIVLNNNDAYTFNFWIFYSTDHIKRQLQWIHDTLLQAEADNEKVHILLHIPSGNEVYRGWSEVYSKIVDRFHHIITGQFSGHTHKNEFFIAYDRANAQHAIGINFNGGSVTPYSYVNPNYLVYYVDKKSFEVVDVDFYMFDLDEINKSAETPVFTKLYSFRQQWNMEDLSPKSFNSLVERWSKDVNGELRQYWELQGKNARPHMAKNCSNVCLWNELCQIVSTNVNDDRRCGSLGARS